MRGGRRFSVEMSRVSPPPGLCAREAEQAAEHLQVLATGQDLVDGRELPGQAEQLTNGGWLTRDISPEDLRPPLIGHEQRGEDPNEGCLARTIWPEQPKDRALGHREVDTGQRNRRPEALRYALHPSRGRG